MSENFLNDDEVSGEKQTVTFFNNGDSKPEDLDRGDPPPGFANQLQLIQNSVSKSSSEISREDRKTIEDDNEIDPVKYNRPLEHLGSFNDYSEILSKEKIQITIFLGDSFEMDLSVYDLKKEERSWCLLLDKEIRFRLKPTEDLKIKMDGVIYNMTYLDQCFSFPNLPFQIMVLIVKDG